MIPSRHSIIWIIALAVYLVPLGLRPMVAPDEYRYAEIPREMIESGDWISPHLVGVRYFEKPVLGYWLTAVSMSVLGDHAFAHRLPSALSVLGAALLLGLLVRSRREGRSAQVLTALVFMSSLLVFSIGTYNVLDSPLSLFTTGSLVMFFLAFDAPTARRRRWFLSLFGVFCGLAFLTKGFLAFAVPVVTIAPFLLWERRLRDLLVLPWIPILFAVLISLPWALAIHAREPDFWRHFFWMEHVDRFTSPEADHPQPFWFLAPFLVLGALPWTALIPAAIRGLKDRGFHDPLVRYAICWCLAPFLFFSMSSGKLGTYVLPCLAPLAVLIALGLVRYCRAKPPGPYFRRGALVLGGFLIVAGLCFAAMERLAVFGDRLYGEEELSKLILVVVGVLLWGGLCLYASRAGSANRAIAAFAVGPLFLIVSSSLLLPRGFEERAAPHRELEQLKARLPDDALLVVGRGYVHAVAWTLKRDDLSVLRLGELRYGFEADPEQHHRVVMAEQLFARFLAGQQKGRPVAVFLERKHYQKLLNSAGPPDDEDVGDFAVYALYHGRGEQ